MPEGFRMHDLRDNRVTSWLAAGKSPVLVQLAMGHSDIATTMGYQHLTAAHLRSLVDDAHDAAPAQSATRATGR
jgi:site-specific recombinase XerD